MFLAWPGQWHGGADLDYARDRDELDDARNTGAQSYGTANDGEADRARNWHDGDNGGPTEVA